MPTEKKPSTNAPVKPEQPQRAINDSDMDFHAGQLEEQKRVKELMDKRYKQLIELFNKETNICNRYELKLRIDELQDTYAMLFGRGV